MKTNILGTYVDVLTFNQAINKLKSYLKTDTNHIVVTPNPEMIVLAKNDSNFKKILNSADLCTADGIGVVYASKLNKPTIKERVCGYDMTVEMIKSYKETNASFYLLGSNENTVSTAVSKLKEKYDGINILGYHNGYFKENEEDKIVKEIQSLKPDILIIGLGMKKQENFATKYKNDLSTKITFCVGGTIDVLSGNVKRAPDIFIKLNLEWFYRLITNPKRILRMLNLPYFAILVILDKFRRK